MFIYSAGIDTNVESRAIIDVNVLLKSARFAPPVHVSTVSLKILQLEYTIQVDVVPSASVLSASSPTT